MPSQLIGENAGAESLAPLNPSDLWPVTSILDWSDGDDDGSRTDVDIVWSGEDTFAALGTNGGVDNGTHGYPENAKRDPEDVFRRRIKLARIAVWQRTYPFGDGDAFMSSITGINKIVSSMEKISQPEVVMSANALGETIRQRRQISYEEQVELFNGLVQQEEEGVMLKLVETGSRRDDRDTKLARLQSFSLVPPKALGEGEKEQDFSIGVILGDQKGQLGVEPDGYTATGVYIPSKPASWLAGYIAR